MAKQVIVMRSDLKNKDGHRLPKGKLIAQGAHASTGALLKLMETNPTGKFLPIESHSPLDEWINGIFKKICLKVSSEEELLSVYEQALQEELNAVLIQDQGHTEFDRPTYTCIGIGPDNEEKLDQVTGHLPLFS